jgi:hypothetical protein
VKQGRKPKRRQCAKCPWKVTTDPHDIPNGYCEKKHANLRNTIADGPSYALGGSIRMMACHETHDLPCIGWLVNQLGPGNNIPLRLMASAGKIDANVELDGEQHERFEDTLP